MAGSYNHAVAHAYADEPVRPGYREGQFLSNEDFVQMIENLGDAYEMAEEMYGMIQLLAGANPDRIEWAKQNYKIGVRLGGGVPWDESPRYRR